MVSGKRSTVSAVQYAKYKAKIFDPVEYKRAVKKILVDQLLKRFF
ncbi:MAG: hypothetical protein CM15mV42_1210 [uncultured marine virus]|nr:MAG: hypothetical protein CM15mV42_1210 [uncultured marine virus]